MRYGVVPTKIFLHEKFSNITRKFLDLRYLVNIIYRAIEVAILYMYTNIYQAFNFYQCTGEEVIL